MASDQPIMKKQKINICALLMIIFVQIVSLLLLNSLFIAFNEQICTLTFIKSVILIFVSFIYMGIDLFFFYTRIILLKKLLHKKPIRCKIEDIIYINYKEEGRTRYSPYPIIRSEESGKLFFTYDRYSLVHFNTNSIYANNRMTDCTIYKKGHIPVKIGDSVYMYLLKTLDVPISIDIEKNTIKLKNKKFNFYHKNDKFAITIFNQISFFQGVIDLDEE